MKRSIFLLLITMVTLKVQGLAQNSLGSIVGDESDLYAQTKQVNQFFRRFNNEEDRFGNRVYPGDKNYRDNEFRKVYLEMIFDQQSPFIDKALRKEFIEEVTGTNNPQFLDFHGGNWFAELPATFLYGSQVKTMLLFLQLEKENLGSKWVITNVYFDEFLKHFNKGDQEVASSSFLHPMSHELDFMNIYKVFRDPRYSEYFASNTFKPDFRTLLFYEVKKGNLEFVKAGQVKFHFFQVDGWYFEVSYFNRPGNNAGWLISKLFRITEEEKKALIQFYLP